MNTEIIPFLSTNRFLVDNSLRLDVYLQEEFSINLPTQTKNPDGLSLNFQISVVLKIHYCWLELA